MRACLSCGKALSRRKERGHRERMYCSDVCRQRAYRERHQEKHNLDRLIKDANERWWNAVEQDIHRETWQEDLERNQTLLKHSLERLAQMRDWSDYLEEYTSALQKQVESLNDRLAEKEAEIVHLTMLLESQSKRR